jgi:hypothetical protein
MSNQGTWEVKPDNGQTVPESSGCGSSCFHEAEVEDSPGNALVTDFSLNRQADLAKESKPLRSRSFMFAGQSWEAACQFPAKGPRQHHFRANFTEPGPETPDKRFWARPSTPRPASRWVFSSLNLFDEYPETG